MRQVPAYLGISLLIGICGCTHYCGDATKNDITLSSVDKSKYILTSEPEGAVGVSEARTESKDQDDIVMIGRIGGGNDPWIQGRAAFMVIDASMTVVADGEETAADEICLDDCCASLRAQYTTLVKIVDEHGNPLGIDARRLLNAQEHDLVVVQGKVHRNDEQSSFMIAATGVYLRQ